MAAMSAYTIANLKEVEDQAPKFGLSPDLEAHFASTPLGLTQSGVSYQRFAPGFRAPFGHKHGSQEELYVLVSGSGRLKLDDEVVELKQWDAVRIDKDTMRNVEAGPNGIEFVAFGAGDDPRDAEMAPGWWSD